MCQRCKSPHIPIDILLKLPSGGKFLGFTKAKECIQLSATETMLKHVVAIRWEWQDQFVKRISIYSIETGEYIEED
jgi:hypothetical protein